MNKLEQETNFSKYLDYAQVEEKILYFYFEENEIKEWIKSKIPDNKIQAIIDQLETDYIISSFIDEDEIKEIIVNYNYDFDKIKEWVEGKM